MDRRASHRPSRTRRSSAILASLAGAVVVMGCGAGADAPEDGPDSSGVELQNGLWYGASGFEPRTYYIVEGALEDTRPAVVDSVVDLAGGFVVPPFGDAHTHNLDGAFDLDRVRDAYVREGTFYVAVLTNTASGANTVRERFNVPCGIDVRYANGGVTGTLSHPFLAYEPRAMRLSGDWAEHAEEIRESRIRENDAYWFVDSERDLEEKWPSILGGQPDLLKIFLLDAREDPPPMSDEGLPSGHGLRPSVARRVVARARSEGIEVAAHVETAADFALAVDAGVTLIAHMPGYGMGIDADGRAQPGGSPSAFEISTAAAIEAGSRGVGVTPTVSWTYVGSGPDSVAAVAARHDVMTRNIRVLREQGVAILVGSDWFGDTATREIRAMQALEVWDAAELLRMWAVDTPRAIFPGRRIGLLEAGYEASFLVLNENPLDRFEAVHDIRLRVKQGCVLADPAGE